MVCEIPTCNFRFPLLVLARVLEPLARISLLGEVSRVLCSVDNHWSSGVVIARETIYSVGALGSSTS